MPKRKSVKKRNYNRKKTRSRVSARVRAMTMRRRRKRKRRTSKRGGSDPKPIWDNVVIGELLPKIFARLDERSLGAAASVSHQWLPPAQMALVEVTAKAKDEIKSIAEMARAVMKTNPNTMVGDLNKVCESLDKAIALGDKFEKKLSIEEKGEVSDMLWYKAYFQRSIEEENRRLADSARIGDVETVKLLLEEGVDPMAFWARGGLAMAASGGHVECMEALVGAGTDINCEMDGDSPLAFAARGGHKAAVEWLLANDADWRSKGALGRTALDSARAWGMTEAVPVLEEWIAEHGSADEVAELQWPAIKKVKLKIIDGDVEAVRRCLAEGVDPNAVGKEGETALYFAAQKNQIECMEALRSAGAELDKGNTIIGFTPLMRAAYEGHTAAVEWLLGRGADLGLKVTDKTALDWAQEAGQKEMVDLLKGLHWSEMQGKWLSPDKHHSL